MEIILPTHGLFRSEGWKNLQHSFSDAQNATTHSERTAKCTSDCEAKQLSNGKRRQEKAERAKRHAEQGKPQVVATIIGRSVLNRVLRLVKELGYEVASISESESWFFKKYNVTFKRK